jgi:hypothetical protein
VKIAFRATIGAKLSLNSNTTGPLDTNSAIQGFKKEISLGALVSLSASIPGLACLVKVAERDTEILVGVTQTRSISLCL